MKCRYAITPDSACVVISYVALWTRMMLCSIFHLTNIEWYCSTYYPCNIKHIRWPFVRVTEISFITSALSPVTTLHAPNHRLINNMGWITANLNITVLGVPLLRFLHSIQAFKSFSHFYLRENTDYWWLKFHEFLGYVHTSSQGPSRISREISLSFKTRADGMFHVAGKGYLLDCYTVTITGGLLIPH